MCLRGGFKLNVIATDFEPDYSLDMKTNLSVSIILLLVLFTTNLSSRYSSKKIRVSTTSTEIRISEYEVNRVLESNLPPVFNYLLVFLQNSSSEDIAALTFIDSHHISNQDREFSLSCSLSSSLLVKYISSAFF
jgi:hypothetical protein